MNSFRSLVYPPAHATATGLSLPRQRLCACGVTVEVQTEPRQAVPAASTCITVASYRRCPSELGRTAQLATI